MTIVKKEAIIIDRGDLVVATVAQNAEDDALDGRVVDAEDHTLTHTHR